ncbi:DUF2252 domain-containing protein [Geodermatophilus marinus]|uniref:DUF2252 domain-containing protein n=1 Tax=Geodermatophilus sp. LHW52908 TaxID=2303986 RepID=UPI001F1FB1EA|nr:DUF2252 domain-containing protein [Geodermatophilus sp. LHW52908]
MLTTGAGDPATRRARGRAVRRSVPLEAHAEVLRKGPDPLALLEEQGRARVPELVPIRYGRMVASPFAFFRGSARVMAADLAAGPDTGLTAQICGDAHLANFGLFASPERRLVFDANDFDETLPGPFEYDVKRLAASLDLAGRENGFSRKQREAVVAAAATRYRTAMARFAGMRDLDVWYSHVDTEFLREQVAPRLDAKRRRRLERGLERARSRDHLRAFGRLTTVAGGRLRIRPQPPLVVPLEDLLPPEQTGDLTGALRELVDGYAETLQSDRRVLLGRYTLVDLARKVVGVGSVGTRCWVLLLVGRDEDDPLLLQVKEAEPSVHAEFLRSNRYRNEGQRVVAGQRLMQQSSDLFLGWRRTQGIDGVHRDFYVRQLWDWKGSVEIEGMRPRAMQIYAELCAWCLARAHARSGDRIAIAGYLGSSPAFDRALVAYADTYADTAERDHRALADAVAAERITATTGV